MLTFHKTIMLAIAMDSSNVLNIRVSKGTSTSKINRELKSLLGDAAGSFRVVSSSLPYYVNEEYIKELLNTVNYRYSKLGARDKERCGFSERASFFKALLSSGGKS